MDLTRLGVVAGGSTSTRAQLGPMAISLLFRQHGVSLFEALESSGP